MALLMRGALVVLSLAAACYSPQIDECKVRCAADNSCPSGTSCLADSFCHADLSSSCTRLPDGGFGVIDGRGGDAPPFAVDARVPDAPIGAPDAPVVTPDAPLPDAPLPDAGACQPTVTTLDDNGFMLVSNLSVDRFDNVHITYVDDIALELLYMHRAPGGAWQREPVVAAGPYLKGQTVDSAGGVHVAFTEGSLLQLRVRYAHRTPDGQWSDETISQAGGPIDASIVVDPDNAIHVAYFSQSLGQLTYAHRTANTSHWTIATIDDGGTSNDVGEFPSLARAPTGGLFVTYRDITAGNLKLAALGSSGWIARTIDDSSANVGAYSALAIDATGNLHVAYADLTNDVLKYLVASGASVARVTADDTDAVGTFNGIALDPAGGVHISTYAYGEHHLHYVHGAPGADGFTVQDVDTSGDDVGRHTSIGVDSTGAVHISYIDDTTHALKYALICPPGP